MLACCVLVDNIMYVCFIETQVHHTLSVFNLSLCQSWFTVVPPVVYDHDICFLPVMHAGTYG